jgi:predicted DNA repair protein MutK
MPAASLFLLLDDIASVLDDVAAMTKVAARKTSGVLGDDLALNAQQVSGVASERELPVVWAVAKGSAINKAILVPSALIISAWMPQAIAWLLVAGGLYLCFEGAEKLLHHWLAHPVGEAGHTGAGLQPSESDKIKGAVRTDFVLSAEIIVITLGVVAGKALPTQIGVLVGVAVLMTVGVYGLVAAIVKLDDLGFWLVARPQPGARALGRGILKAAPCFMRLLSFAGTVAMFMVGGSILVHNLEPLHHALLEISWLGTPVAMMLAEAFSGLVIGMALALAVVGIGKLRR